MASRASSGKVSGETEPLAVMISRSEKYGLRSPHPAIMGLWRTEPLGTNLIAMASNLLAMASPTYYTSNLLAMAFNLPAMASPTY